MVEDDADSGALIPLNDAETQELAGLEREMSDTRGQHVSHWTESYWHRPDKQARYRALMARQEAAKTTPAHVEAEVNADRRIQELIRAPDYWKDAAKQAEVARLIRGQTQDGAKAPPTDVSSEAVQAWAKALDASAEDVQGGLANAAEIQRSLTADSIQTFDGLSDETVQWCMAGLLPGANANAVLEAAPPRVQAEFRQWASGLNSAERAVIRQRLGV